MALPKPYEATARFGATSTTGDPEGEIAETGRRPERRPELPIGRLRQRPPAYSAVKVAGRRAYALARAGDTTLVLPEREIEVRRFEETWRDGDRRGFRDRVLIRNICAQPDRGPRRRVLRAAAPHRDRPVRRDGADPETVIPLARALEFLPEVRVGHEQARRAGHGDARSSGPGGGSRAGVVRLTGEDGLIALAEPREDGSELKPVVGSRRRWRPPRSHAVKPSSLEQHQHMQAARS